MKGVVSKEHVHIPLNSPPNLVPSEIMRRIKGGAASKLFEELPYLKKRYLGHEVTSARRLGRRRKR